MFVFLISCSEKNVDELYAQGFELSQNNKHKQAFVIMLDLANKNHPAATQNIALSYKYGLGVKKNKELAFKYFLKAHKLGILDATNEVANIYYQRKNTQKAVELWKLASDKNDEYASYNLGVYYFEIGNKTLAKKYLLKAKKLQHPQAESFIRKYKL